MSLEICEICEEPTGNAGLMDGSLQCVKCGQIICSECLSRTDEDTGERYCKECDRGEA